MRLVRGPTKPPGMGATGQSVVGTDIAVGVTEGGFDGVCVSRRTDTARQSPIEPC
jgi:hypothetical protein